MKAQTLSTCTDTFDQAAFDVIAALGSSNIRRRKKLNAIFDLTPK